MTMPNAHRYPFIAADSALGEASFRPYLPLTLAYQGQTAVTAGLLDTGAAVNVLPFRIGVELGAIWQQQTTLLQLTGNLACSSLQRLAHFNRYDWLLHGHQQNMCRFCLVRRTSLWNSMFVFIARH